jgi:hypothetical protein
MALVADSDLICGHGANIMIISTSSMNRSVEKRDKASIDVKLALSPCSCSICTQLINLIATAPHCTPKRISAMTSLQLHSTPGTLAPNTFLITARVGSHRLKVKTLTGKICVAGGGEGAADEKDGHVTRCDD